MCCRRRWSSSLSSSLCPSSSFVPCVVLASLRPCVLASSRVVLARRPRVVFTSFLRRCVVFTSSSRRCVVLTSRVVASSLRLASLRRPCIVAYPCVSLRPFIAASLRHGVTALSYFRSCICRSGGEVPMQVALRCAVSNCCTCCTTPCMLYVCRVASCKSCTLSVSLDAFKRTFKHFRTLHSLHE